MSDQTTTAKRAIYENIEMNPRDGHVIVRNASHADPDEHEYRVEIGICGDAASCTCPDYEYRREPRGELCKHMKRVQLADPVREAATPNVETDGGVDAEPAPDSDDSDDDGCDACAAMSGDLSCFDCYEGGDR